MAKGMREEYTGIIMNYRIGPKRQRSRECIIKVLDADPSESRRLIGWKVHWPHNDPKLVGRISKLHGKSGALRVKFRIGLPGQALSSRVTISR